MKGHFRQNFHIQGLKCKFSKVQGLKGKLFFLTRINEEFILYENKKKKNYMINKGKQISHV